MSDRGLVRALIVCVVVDFVLAAVNVATGDLWLALVLAVVGSFALVAAAVIRG